MRPISRISPHRIYDAPMGDDVSSDGAESGELIAARQESLVRSAGGATPSVGATGAFQLGHQGPISRSARRLRFAVGLGVTVGGLVLLVLAAVTASHQGLPTHELGLLLLGALGILCGAATLIDTKRARVATDEPDAATS